MSDGPGIWSYGGKFTEICSKIFDLMILGFLWILCCIPLVTIGASTAALYYAVVKCVKGNRGYAASEFFHSFRQNLKQGIILTLIFAAAVFILQLNVGILQAKMDGYVGLFFIVLYQITTVFVILTALYAFPALSRYDREIGWILKVSMFMVIRYFLTTIALALVIACFGAFVWRIPVLFFFVPGFAMFVASEFLERVLKKHE